MATIIGIAGSLRKASFNASLLRAAVEVTPPGHHVEIASIRDIPLYDGDVEAAGIPEPVRALKDRIAAADGLLLVTPEYNHSLPGVLKNVIDWLSRPPADGARVFRGKPVALMGATQGAAGTILAQNAWLPVLRALGTQPYFGGRLLVSGAANVFNHEGKLVDDTVRENLVKFMAGFTEFVARETKS